MSGLRERLQRLTKTSASAAENAGRLALDAEPATDTPDFARSGMAPAKEDPWKRIDAEIVSEDGAAFIRRTRRYSREDAHGRYLLGRVNHHAHTLSVLSSSGEPVSAEQLLFLDTETTGLGVGAGNVPFMIGYGFVEGDSFVVEQLFIRNPAEEYAALRYLQGKLDRFKHMVTYNGRSFDWPVLKNRFVLHRMAPPEEPGHIDFLYPSRSLWKRTLPSCKLGVVEEKKLGYERGDDLPGAQAPVMYVQYLTTSRIEDVEGVFVHNERDILSLAALAIRFQELLGGVAADNGVIPEEGVRLAWWLDKLGKRTIAENVLERTLHTGGLKRSQLLEAASLCKKWGKLETAASLWRRHHESGSSATRSLEPLIELAMYHEHRLRDMEGALGWALKARAVIERRLALGRGIKADRTLLEEIDRRLDRLRRKGGRPQQGMLMFP